MTEDYSPETKVTPQESEGGGGFWGRTPRRARWGAVPVGAIVLVVLSLLLQAPPVKCETEEGMEPMRSVISNESAYFADDHVVVTGAKRRVNSVTKQVGELDRIRRCKLNYQMRLWGLQDSIRWSLPNLLTSRQGVPARVAYPRPEDRVGLFPGKPTVGLYKIEDGRSVQEVVEALNTAGQDRGVSADPNYLTGLLDVSACGRPNTDGGSPFNEPAQPLPAGEAAVGQFWEQEAFDTIEVGQADGVWQGNGVLVGVFDTSPFPDPWTDASNPAGVDIAKASPEPIKWGVWDAGGADVETLDLDVRYPDPEGLDAIEAVDVQNQEGEPEIVSNHGLFVAGLVKAVAPDSEIRLIRVLDEHGCGDLFTLNEGLHDFYNEMTTGRETYQHVVLNLSLGLVKPDETVEEVRSVREVLYNFHEAGAVIVAAAGNDSGWVDSTGQSNQLSVEPPQIPAAYDFVIGVEASNGEAQRSCFSNRGDLMAPGGDGGPARKGQYVPQDEENDRDRRLCTAQHKVCEEGDECEQTTVISLLWPQDTNWPTYGYWSGTSFSAPLVSGLAARVLEATTGAEPHTISRYIHCGTAPSPDGVINIPATLFDCIPSSQESEARSAQ